MAFTPGVVVRTHKDCIGPCGRRLALDCFPAGYSNHADSNTCRDCLSNAKKRWKARKKFDAAVEKAAGMSVCETVPFTPDLMVNPNPLRSEEEMLADVAKRREAIGKREK